MKKLSWCCHGVWQLICLIFCFEPILGSSDAYWNCLFFWALIGIPILVCCIIGVDKIQKAIINSGYASHVIYLLIFLIGAIISYVYSSTLFHVWLFMIVTEFFTWWMIKIRNKQDAGK